MCAGRQQPGQRARQPLQRRKQNIGQDKIEWSARTKAMGVEPGRRNAFDCGGRRVQPRILARDREGKGINVARQDASSQRLGRRNGEHAGAGADVEDTK